jgi:hypothetical protein
MHKLLAIVVLLLLTGCSGGHALDNPVKTCKAVTIALASDSGVVWHGEKQTEQKGVQLQVALDFTLVGQPAGDVSQSVCIYGLSSQDMDYRNTMGEYANTPTSMMINGMPVPENDLVQAVNKATADAARGLIQQ